MRTMKTAVLALTLGAIGLTAAAPAMARPHKRKVCSVEWVHHHKVRRCHWR